MIHAFVTRRKKERLFLKMSEAATVIQACVKGRAARHLLCRQHAAASHLQGWYRGYKVRKGCSQKVCMHCRC
jgi:hypothetical protein